VNRTGWKTANGEKGFTVSEALVVVAIIGVIVLVTLPALGERYRGYQVRSATNDLVADLRVARHTAITQRTTVDFTVNDESDSPPNRYSYIRANGETRTVEMEDNVAITAAPATALEFEQDGGLDGAAGTIILQTQVSDTRIDRYTVVVSTVGTVAVDFDAVAP
jgi:Tfp pilus assembly protein FimT